MEPDSSRIISSFFSTAILYQKKKTKMRTRKMRRKEERENEILKTAVVEMDLTSHDRIKRKPRSLIFLFPNSFTEENQEVKEPIAKQWRIEPF